LVVEPPKSHQIVKTKPQLDWPEANDSPFMQACRLEKSTMTPIWLMRQAGRYLPSYREIRAKVGFLELCKNPQLAAEVTVNAVEELGVDAAIIFADILLILEPLGAHLEFSKGEGPIIHNPVRTEADVVKLRRAPLTNELDFVMQALLLARQSLPKAIPLIGFAGAPFTLASYLIEGGSSRNFEKTKIFMYQYPQAWHQLMEILAEAISDYLIRQADAGAQAVQIFDSWVGCLGVNDYEEYVQPHMIRTISGIKNRLPVIHFGTATAHLLKHMAASGADVIGLDWRVPLSSAWDAIGDSFAVQGNFDPVALFSSQAQIKKRAKDILAQANGRPGHIFNLGHGVLPGTPVENVKYLVEVVHELSQG
jgi:uroporphyrinogen decarboxylase